MWSLIREEAEIRGDPARANKSTRRGFIGLLARSAALSFAIPTGLVADGALSAARAIGDQLLSDSAETVETQGSSDVRLSEAIRARWSARASIRRIAKELRMSPSRVRVRAQRLGLPIRPRDSIRD
jgi:hypothetical protein